MDLDRIIKEALYLPINKEAEEEIEAKKKRKAPKKRRGEEGSDYEPSSQWSDKVREYSFQGFWDYTRNIGKNGALAGMVKEAVMESLSDKPFEDIRDQEPPDEYEGPEAYDEEDGYVVVFFSSGGTTRMVEDACIPAVYSREDATKIATTINNAKPFLSSNLDAAFEFIAEPVNYWESPLAG